MKTRKWEQQNWDKRLLLLATENIHFKFDIKAHIQNAFMIEFERMVVSDLTNFKDLEEICRNRTRWLH